MKTHAIVIMGIVAATAVCAAGCATESVEPGEETQATEANEGAGAATEALKKNSCTPGFGCRFQACYNACIPQSNENYCITYCKCRASGKSQWVCEGENPYIDILR